MNEKETVVAEGTDLSWNEQYDNLIKNPPEAGAVLGSMDDSKVLLAIDTVEGSAPFVHGCAFVPEIVGAKLGWFLQSVDSEGFHGYKCILMPRARTELIRRLGLSNEIVEVTSLRVVKPSQSGKSLLCEVAEY